MPEFKEDDLVVVTTTVATLDDARRLARAIVDARLAACVQLDALSASFYRWEGKLCDEAEVRLTIKTVRPQLGALEALFSREHPYELPQFVVVPCSASGAYAGWVRSEAQG